MQSELMLRLLLRNKIVGYEYLDNGMHFQDERIGHLETCSFENCPQRSFILWDSFELGVKVGETWVFEGDILQVTLSYNDVKEYISGILRFNGERFFMENTDTDEEKWASLLGIEAFFQDGCLVGNIHEEEKP